MYVDLSYLGGAAFGVLLTSTSNTSVAIASVVERSFGRIVLNVRLQTKRSRYCLLFGGGRGKKVCPKPRPLKLILHCQLYCC